jgi:hypothetical protein
MARDEHQAQQVVVNLLVRRSEIGYRSPRGQLAFERLRFCRERLVATDAVDCAAFCDRYEPRARIARDAFAGPLCECRNEGVLREFFGAAYVARQPRQRRDELRRFDSPNGRNRRLEVRAQRS